MPKRKANRHAPAQNVAKKPRAEEESDDEPPAWQKIKFKDLDFDVSYVGNIESPKRYPRSKGGRWTHDGDEPLLNPEDLPRKRTSEEPDLDHECVNTVDEDFNTDTHKLFISFPFSRDFDAQIAQCRERIDEDRILPYLFESKLRRLKEDKKAKEHVNTVSISI